MKKVLLITRSFDHQIGGMETHAYLLVKYLKEHGFNITILTPQLNSSAMFALKNVTINRISRKPNDLLKYSFSFWYAVRKFIIQHSDKYDYIIGVSMATALLSSSIVSKRNLNITSILHGTYELERKSLNNRLFSSNFSIKTLLGIPYCWAMKFVERRIIHLSRKIIVISDNILKDLKSRYTEHEMNKVSLVKNFVDTDSFAFKKRNFNSKKCLRLLYVGRLHSEKGVDMFLELSQYLKKHSINFCLSIVGDGEEYKRLLKFANTKNEVNIVGPISNKEVPSYLYKADVFLFPTKRTGEGLPISVIEAMSTGLPVVASNIPSMKALIDDKKDSFLFKRADGYNFQKVMHDISANTDNLREISRRARKKIERSYSLKKNLKKIVEIITK